MFQDKMVLCASSAYEKKFYLNENFEGLPQHVKDELKIMCVLFTEDVGGVLSLEFDENGKEKNRYEYNPDRVFTDLEEDGLYKVSDFDNLTIRPAYFLESCNDLMTEPFTLPLTFR